MSARPFRYLAAVSGVCLILLLAGCGASGNAAASTGATATPVTVGGAKLRAVTTMSILADMIKQVGGAHVTVKNIIPLGAVAESYQPTPQDVRDIAQADVIFFNGHGLEAWLEALFQSAKNDRAPKVELSKDLPAVDVGSQDFKLGNPHFWLNPQYAVKYVEVIRDTFAQLDTANASTYRANAAAYIAKLNALDKDLEAQAAQLPVAERKMVTNHDAFPYFAKRYGFTIVGNILGNPEAALSAGDLAQLTRKVKSEHVKAIFSESQFNPKVSETLAKDAGVAIVANLYTDSLGSGSEAATYLDMMRYDMRTIVQALSGKASQ
jgi:ABC-type Zn uptake system ZnuABC Zn-binding protein ZnuA